MPTVDIHNAQELARWRDTVRDRARRTYEWISELGDDDPMALLYALRYEQCGYDPLACPPRRYNLTEQWNQTFTIMASLSAADHLFEWFHVPGGLRLNLATAAGWDIESMGDDLIRAEVFTAVRPNNNGKLQHDIQELAKSGATHRYVFFYAPNYAPGRHPELEPEGTGIQVWVLGQEEVT